MVLSLFEIHRKLKKLNKKTKFSYIIE